MTDESAATCTEPQDGEPQSLYVIRHGDRWDYSHPMVSCRYIHAGTNPSPCVHVRLDIVFAVVPMFVSCCGLVSFGICLSDNVLQC